MERLTIEYCGEYVPKGLCSIDRQGGADDCELCYENCKAMEEGNEDCSGCAINQCFHRLGEYESIGTVEECRKARELQRAIEPKMETERNNSLLSHNITVKQYKCPACSLTLINRDDTGFYAGRKYSFCPDCGQSMDWSGVE